MRFAFVIGFVTAIAAGLYFWLTLRGAQETYGALEVYTGIARSSFYFGLAAFSCSYALRCGGPPERAVAMIILAGLVVDPLLHQLFSLRVSRPDPTHILVDGGTLIAFVAISLRALRIWTLWLSAFQLLSLGAHGAKAMNLAIHPVAYVAMAVIWAYGMLALLIGATRYHQRAVARGATRKSWRHSLPR